MGDDRARPRPIAAGAALPAPGILEGDVLELDPYSQTWRPVPSAWRPPAGWRAATGDRGRPFVYVDRRRVR